MYSRHVLYSQTNNQIIYRKIFNFYGLAIADTDGLSLEAWTLHHGNASSLSDFQ